MTAVNRLKPRFGWVEHLAVVFLYALVACLMTWPLVRILDQAVLGPPGDNLEYVWKIAWFKRAVVDLKASPFHHPGVFYPVGYPVALSETTTVHTLLGLPLTVLWGEVVSYNLMMLGSYVLSGYGAYLWLRALNVGSGGAFCAGIAFAFCPYRMSHLGAGHLPLMGTGFIALLFWAIERFAQRPDMRRGSLMGLAYALMALSSWYYAAMVAPFAAIYLAWRLRPWRVLLKDGRVWRGAVIALFLAMALVAPAGMPLFRLYRSGQAEYTGSMAYVDQWSASPVDLVYPNAMHSIWGASLTDAYYQNINENLIYLGLVVLLLAGIGLTLSGAGRSARLLTALAGITALLACGTTLHFAGEPVYVSVSERVGEFFSRGMYTLTTRLALNHLDYGSMHRSGAVPIPLPTLLLYLFVPFMNAMRVWSRFAVLTMLFASALAGMGVDALHRGAGVLPLASACGKVWCYVIVPLIALLILCDFAVLPYPYGYTLTRVQPLDRWLADQDRPSPVIHYPLDKTWYGWMLYPEEVHRQPIAYGYGTFMPAEYVEHEPVLRGWPSNDTLDLLRGWRVRYVVVGAKGYGDAWPQMQREIAGLAGVDLVARFEDLPRYEGDRLLHRIAATADVPSTELINGPQRVYLDDDLYVYEIR